MLLGNEFYTKDEELVEFNQLVQAKDFIAIYFGGLYNPGSVKFTEQLAMFYYEINSSEKLVEVVYVSFDRNYKEYRKNMDMMPWVALPYQDYRTQKLKFVFNATEIPKLVFLRVKDATIASDDGKDLVLRLGKQAVHYLKFHQYHSNTLTNNTQMIEEQIKRDAMRKEIMDSMFDDDGLNDREYARVDHDERPVIGLKSDMELYYK